MYHKTDYDTENNNAPFIIQCTNCGSHDVDVVAYDHWDLDLKCNKCGSYLNIGKYNETRYKGE